MFCGLYQNQKMQKLIFVIAFVFCNAIGMAVSIPPQDTTLPSYLEGAPKEIVDAFNKAIADKSKSVTELKKAVEEIVAKQSDVQAKYQQYQKANNEGKEQVSKIMAIFRDPKLSIDEMEQKGTQEFGKLPSEEAKQFMSKFGKCLVDSVGPLEAEKKKCEKCKCCCRISAGIDTVCACEYCPKK